MKKIYFFLVLLLILSCSENPFSPASEKFKILTFTGEKENLENNEYRLKQVVTWNCNSNEAQFSIRLSGNNANYIGNTDSEGWLLFGKSIWTNQDKYEHTIISQQGVLPYIIQKVEVRYHTSEAEIIKSKNYQRIIGTVASTTACNIDGKTCGTGVTFTLNEKLNDIFVEGIYANHFMYRLNTINAIDSTIVTPGQWHSTLDLPEIRKVYLNSETTPPLIPNEPDELTQLETYIVTRDGFEDSDNPARLNFTVQDGFSPEAMIYAGIDENGTTGYNLNNTFLLGDNHYELEFPIIYSYSNNIHSSHQDDEIHFSAPFWPDLEGNMTALNSDNLKLYIHLGWHGEYKQDRPANKKYNMVLDGSTDMPYFAKILYSDIKFDGEPPNWDIDGAFIYEGWLRIPVDETQELLYEIDDLASGSHTITHRVVDSQMVADETPLTFSFEIVEPTPPAEKDGILIIDDEYAPTSDDDFIEQFYNAILEDYSGNVAQIDYEELGNTLYQLQLFFLHGHENLIPPSMIDPYKLIIFHSDHPDLNTQTHFSREYQVLKIYLENGGNLFYSRGANSKLEQDNNYTFFANFMNNNFGCLGDGAEYNYIEYGGVIGDFMNMQFFKKANTISGSYPTIELQYPSEVNSIINISDVNPAMGLGPVTFFTNLPYDVEPIYSFGCVVPEAGTSFPEWDTEDDGDPIPSEAQHDYYEGKCVGLKKITSSNKCYSIGFPLSYMVETESHNLMSQIIDEVFE
jgi:hypothetical protein